MTTRNSRVRFLQNNMLQASGVTLTPSGAKATFLVTSLTDPLRYRMWTPPGSFAVTTANQTLYVNDGADKTATITVGTHDYATLADLVQNALNAVSTNWTCTYDFSGGTFKFTIGRTGGGTATLRLSQTTNAAWDMLGYVGAVDQAAAAADEIRCHTSEWFTVDFGVARAPLAFIVLCAIDAVFPFSSGATVTLKANNVNDFTTPAISRTLAFDSYGIVHWLDDLADTSYRYWKFEFSDRLNPAGPESFSLNLAYLGDYVTPTANNIGTGYGRQLTDLSRVQKAVSGTPYVRKLPKVWTWDSFSIDYVSGDDLDALEALAAELGASEFFYLALDPTAALNASATKLTKYVRFTDAPKVTQLIGDMHSFAFAVEEVP